VGEDVPEAEVGAGGTGGEVVTGETGGTVDPPVDPTVVPAVAVGTAGGLTSSSPPSSFFSIISLKTFPF